MPLGISSRAMFFGEMLLQQKPISCGCVDRCPEDLCHIRYVRTKTNIDSAERTKRFVASHGYSIVVVSPCHW